MTTTIRLSLLRAPRFPDPETDHGVHTHRYGLVVGTDVDGAAQEGVVLNTPARVVTGEPRVRRRSSASRVTACTSPASSSLPTAPATSSSASMRRSAGARVAGSGSTVPSRPWSRSNLLEEPLEPAGRAVRAGPGSVGDVHARAVRGPDPALQSSSSAAITWSTALISAEVGERLREVAQVPAAARVDLLGVEPERAGERQQLLAQLPGALHLADRSASADTSQNEQIVKVPSSPARPSSVSSTR